jgi:hypothetical protein
VGLEWGPLSLVNSSGSGLENQEYGRDIRCTDHVTKAPEFFFNLSCSFVTISYHFIITSCAGVLRKLKFLSGEVLRGISCCVRQHVGMH